MFWLANEFYENTLIVFGVTWLAVTLWWLFVMNHALEKIHLANRSMPPGRAWLMLIPLFGFFWQFMIVHEVGEGFKKEFSSRHILTKEPRPGYGVGVSASILFCCILIPSFGILFAFIGHITRIIHTIRIRNYTKELESVQALYIPPSEDQSWANYVPPPDPLVEMQKDNPARFKPPYKPEEDVDRWRPK
jgi:hypothetical protein